MPIYSYEAYDKYGSITNGKLKSKNEEEVLIFLRDKGLLPIKVKKFSFFNTDIQDLEILKNKFTLSKKEVAFFCRQMYFIISSGLSISLGIDTIIKQCDSKLLKQELIKIKEGILKGSSLSECMANSNKFPSLLCSMVQIGEESGKLYTVMEEMEKHYTKEASTLEDIKSAMIYPAFVLVAMIIVIFISLLYLIPNYTVIFLSQEIPLPLPTRVLINSSNFVRGYYIFIFVFLINLLLVLFYINKSIKFKNYRDKVIINIPIFKKYFNLITALRISQAMSIMLDAGVPILNAIDISKNLINNNEFKSVMENIHQEVKKGISITDAIEKSNFFHLVLINMVSIGEESGKLSESLQKSADYFDKEVSIIINRMKKLIEPVITIVIGLILGFIMLAIMLPTLYLTNVI